MPAKKRKSRGTADRSGGAAGDLFRGRLRELIRDECRGTNAVFARRLSDPNVERKLLDKRHDRLAAVSADDSEPIQKVDPSRVTEWLSGRALPGTTTLIRISKVFGVSIDWLCGSNVPRKLNERRLVEGFQLDELGNALRAAFLEPLESTDPKKNANFLDEVARVRSGIEPPAGSRLVFEASHSWWAGALRNETSLWGYRLSYLSDWIEQFFGTLAQGYPRMFPHIEAEQRSAIIDVADKVVHELTLRASGLKSQDRWGAISQFYARHPITVVHVGSAPRVQRRGRTSRMETEHKRKWVTRCRVPAGVGFAIADNARCCVLHLPSEGKAEDPILLDGATHDLVEERARGYRELWFDAESP
jgi:transcriptional regulator with XRE-family HTH domain